MENELALIIEQVPKITQTLPEVIQLNQQSVDKAISYGETLFKEIQEKGMSDEYDQKINDYLVKLKSTTKSLNERRSPITQFFTSIAKQFTNLESQVDQKSGFYTKGQTLRDNWAEKKRKDIEAKERELQLTAAKEKEKIEVKAKMEIELRQFFLTYLEKQQLLLNSILESITLESFENGHNQIKEFPDVYSNSQFQLFKSQVPYSFISKEDFHNIYLNVIVGKFDEYAAEFQNSIFDLKSALVDKLPFKKKELEALALADETEKQRLNNIAQQRKLDDEAKLKSDNESKLLETSKQVENNKQSEVANTLFDLMNGVDAPAKVAQGIEKYEIIVKNPLGYQLIVAFYFEKEGKTESIEKLEKMKLGSMKTFAESWAKKNGEKIQSPLLEYKEVFKTIAKSK
jgi:hypothetical protein